MALEQAIL